MAWHEILHRYEYTDALAAVAKHYSETRERLMPFDVIRQIRAIREERARLEAKHPVRELPGRFESDEERDQRNKDNIERIKREILLPLAAKLSIARAELETALTPAAWWGDENAREQHAAAELERLGRLQPDGGDA